MRALLNRIFAGSVEPLLTESAIGLDTPKRDYLEPARFRIFKFTGLSWLAWPIYLDFYIRTVDNEYGRFRRVPRTSETDPVVEKRVLSAIRSVAAFSAWETVAWAIVQNGFSFAVAVGAATSLVVAMMIVRGFPVFTTIAIASFVVLAARALSLNIPRKWPMSAIVFIALAGGAASVMRLLLPFSSTVWWHGIMSGLSGAVALWAVFALALTVAAIFWIRAVARRIAMFPEEEIIRSIAELLTRLHEWGNSWRSQKRRTLILEKLEWIARRFECEYVERYTGHDRYTDSELERKGRACAKRFRALKHEVVFPSERSRAEIISFLWDALEKATKNRWESLAAGEQPDALPSRRERLAANIRAVSAIAAPIVVGLGFAEFAPVSDEIKRNVLAMTVGWSLLAFIAMLDPKGFESQTKALETFGKLFTVEKR